MHHGSKQHLPLRAGSARRAALLGAATAVASSMASEEAQAFGKNPSDWLGYYKDSMGLKIRLVNAWFTCVLPVYVRKKKTYCPNPFFQMLQRIGASIESTSCFAKCSKSEGPTAPYVPSQDQVWPSSGTLICWFVTMKDGRFIDGCFVSRSVRSVFPKVQGLGKSFGTYETNPKHFKHI